MNKEIYFLADVTLGKNANMHISLNVELFLNFCKTAERHKNMREKSLGGSWWDSKYIWF